MTAIISMQIHSSDIPKKHGTNQRRSSAKENSSFHGSLQGDFENGGQQQRQQAALGKRFSSTSPTSRDVQRFIQDGIIMPHHLYASHEDPSTVVFSPRVPGEGSSRRDRSRRSVSPTLIREILEKSGMALKVPNFLERMAGDSREGLKAKFKLRPYTQGDHHRLRTLRLKSSGPGLVTVPVSAKQWLLQAVGLKDSEICELFNQMESMPQFAAEYVREVKDEWQALESRGIKKPPEAENLLKDQALLEKVRALIFRFARVQQSEESFAKQQEFQTSREKDNKASCFRPRSQNRSIHLQVERNPCDVQDDRKVDNTDLSRPDTGTLIREIDEIDDIETTRKIICPSCGQFKATLSSLNCQRVVPTTGTGQRPSSPRLRHVLPSFIPVDDYIVKHCVVQPEIHGKMEHKSRFSPLDKRWYTVLFPALQPGRREDVQLLGEWLQHSMHRNCYENSDGHFEDAEAAFILHSIAFLEIVRQVDLQCEERGNLLLHVWRQILRVFNQGR